MYEWDEKKRLANIEKHGLDFADAHLVYENPAKVTIDTAFKAERRQQDLAIVEAVDGMLSLVYVRRRNYIRVISFRPASRKERRKYAEAKR